MAHIESVGQAMWRLESAAERLERTVQRAGDDEDRVSRARFHHLRTSRNARLQVRFNGGLRGLERGILGAGGSPEDVERYRKLEKEVGEHADEPLVLVKSVSEDGDRLDQAVVGEVSGPLQIRASFLGKGIPGDIREPRQQASLVIPTADTLLKFVRDEEDWHIKGVENGSHLEVARIVLDEAANSTHDDEGEGEFIADPEKDVLIYEDGADLLVGAEAVRASELFEPDLKTILNLATTPV